ncbi:MAG TPA: hypothetical protein PKZ56_00910 [Candidatus Paceibacterota bacterium]|nr:hypothetical protein [Candidatus Paceibacterota bacterium]
MLKSEWFKYVLSFLVTGTILVLIFYVSDLANKKRIEEMRSIQDNITIDLLSSETQFSLLNKSSCTQDSTSILSSEVNKLSERLGYMEEKFGSENANVISLKKNYSLLLIKDYLLMSELSKKCNIKPIFIFYFYSQDCEECRRQNYVFAALREKYPDLRVYSFDTSLDLSAINTLLTMNKVPKIYPAIVVDNKVYTGFKSIEEVESSSPELTKIIKDEAAKAAKAAAQTSVKLVPAVKGKEGLPVVEPEVEPADSATSNEAQP